MPTVYRRLRWALLLLPLIFVFTVAMSSQLLSTASAASSGGCAGLVAGQYIYDCTGLLTPSENAYLETQAAAVVRAGAPTVIYLQVRAATAEQTLQDAIDLMNRWNVESRPARRYTSHPNVLTRRIISSQTSLFPPRTQRSDLERSITE
jgi:hypothetical protein